MPTTPSTPGANIYSSLLANEKFDDLDGESVLSDSHNESAAANIDFLDNSDARYKGKPMRGYKLLVFNVLMIIGLTIYLGNDYYQAHKDEVNNWINKIDKEIHDVIHKDDKPA